MARKKSDTLQGDSVPGPEDEASAAVPSAEPVAAESPTVDEPPLPGSPSEPWDPAVAPESSPAPEATSEPEPATADDTLLPAEGTAEAAPVEPWSAEPTDAPSSQPSSDDPAPIEAPEPIDPDPVEAAAIEDVADREAAARTYAAEPDRYGEPVAEAVDEHEEDAGWSIAGRALAALVLLLAGAGIGIWAAPKIAPALPAGMAPVARWLTPGQAEAVAALQAKVDGDLAALRAQVAALPAGDAVDARVSAAVSAAETKLSAEIAAAKQEAGPDLTAVNQRLAALSAAVENQTTQLGDLKGQLGGAAGDLSQDALARIDAYKGEVQALTEEMGGVRDQVSGLATRLDAAEARADREVSAAQATVGALEAKARTEVSASAAAADVAEIRAAIAGGTPFQQPLAALGQTGTTAPAGLADAAEGGVETLTALRESYPEAAHAAIEASIMASAGSGVLARSKAFLEAQVASRSLTPQTGEGTDAVLSRMEDKLRQDDLAGVLSEAEGLPSEASAAMADWLAAARARAAALEGLATLDASLTKTN